MPLAGQMLNSPVDKLSKKNCLPGPVEGAQGRPVEARLAKGKRSNESTIFFPTG
jgi:hypothetical protein